MEAAADKILVLHGLHLSFISSVSQVLPGIVKKGNQDNPPIKLGEEKLQSLFEDGLGDPSYLFRMHRKTMLFNNSRVNESHIPSVSCYHLPISSVSYACSPLNMMFWHYQ